MNMAISNAANGAPAGTAVATRQPSRTEQFVGQVLPADTWSELKRALPAHVRPDRFRRNFMNAVMQAPQLLECHPQMVFREVSKAAGLGLELDPQLGEAYLVIRNVKLPNGQWGKAPNLQVGYRGMLKLARQAGETAVIYAHEVAENDIFECSLGDEKRLTHKPTMFGDRGDVVGFYAVVKYRAGETDFEIMSRQQVDAIRDKSDGWQAYKVGRIKDTPWASAYEEMAKKTVLRRLMKRVPQSSDMADQLAEEDRAEYVEAEVREVPMATPPAQIAAPQVEQPPARRRGRPPKDAQEQPRSTVSAATAEPAAGPVEAASEVQPALIDPTAEDADTDGDDLPFDAPGTDDVSETVPPAAPASTAPASEDDWANGL